MKDKGQAMAAGASMAIEGIATVLSVVGNQIAENRRAQEEWEMAVLSTELAYRSLMVDKYDYAESNVFGVESPFAKAVAGVEQYRVAADELDATLKELAEGSVQTGTKKEYSGKNAAIGAAGGALGAMGTAAMIGAAVGTAVGPIGTAIGAAAGAVIGGLVGLFGGKKTVAVYENLLDHYGSLLDESEGAGPFDLNPEIIADYKKLDDETKEIVDHWDEVKGKMEEAHQALEDTISDLAGDIGTELQDALVEAFRNGDLYSAIDDFHEYLTGVLEDLLAQAAFAAVFQDSFEKLQKDLEESDDIQGVGKGNGRTWAEILADFGNTLDEGSEQFFKGLEIVQQMMAGKGYDLYEPDSEDSKDSDSGTLSGGIKSITEDTANLLASYINAIRADVSLMRGQQIEGWLNVKLIAGLMPSPTVWEHLAKIEAHAYDIALSNAQVAQSNTAILSELRSVITSENGIPAVAAVIQ